VPEPLALMRPIDPNSPPPSAAGEVIAANGRPLRIEWTEHGATIGGCRILGHHPLPLGNMLYVVEGVLPSAKP